MKTWIALLRGVNMVGKHKVPMKEFASLLEGLGARDVKTYRGSGNAVFRHRGRVSARLAGRISAAVGKAYGFEPFVMLLDVEQLAQMMAENPFPDAESEPGSLVVGILGEVPEEPDLEAIQAVLKKSERFALCRGVFYYHAPEGFTNSKLGGVLERALGVGKAGTGRTWGTLVKVMTLAKEIDGQQSDAPYC